MIEKFSNWFFKDKDEDERKEEQEKKRKEEQEKKKYDPLHKFVREVMGLDPEDFDFTYKTVERIEPNPEKEGGFLGYFKEFNNYHDLCDFRKTLSNEEKEKMDNLRWQNGWSKITIFAKNSFWDRLENPGDKEYEHKNEFYELYEEIEDEEIEDGYAKAVAPKDKNDLSQVEGDEKSATEQLEGKLPENSLSADKTKEMEEDKRGEGGQTENLKRLAEILLEKLEFQPKQPADKVEIENSQLSRKGLLEEIKEDIKKHRAIAGAIMATLIFSAAGTGLITERGRRKGINSQFTRIMEKVEDHYERRYMETTRKRIGGIEGLKDIIRGIDGDPDNLSYEDKIEFSKDSEKYYEKFLDKQSESYQAYKDDLNKAFEMGQEEHQKQVGAGEAGEQEAPAAKENATQDKGEIEQQFTNAFNIASGDLSEQEIDQLLIIIDGHDTTEDMSVSDIQNAMEDGKIKPDLIRQAKEKAAEQESKEQE